jgi:hypothetical protein
MDAINQHISGLAAVILALAGAFFMLRILVLVFVSQIDLAAGRPGTLADLAEQAVYMLVTLLLAANAQTIGRAFGALAQANNAALLSGDVRQLGVLLGPAAGLALSLAANLAVAFTLMAVVFIALRGQLANLVSSSEGVGRSILQALTALTVLGAGLLAILVGRSLLQ